MKILAIVLVCLLILVACENDNVRSQCGLTTTHQRRAISAGRAS